MDRLFTNVTLAGLCNYLGRDQGCNLYLPRNFTRTDLDRFLASSQKFLPSSSKASAKVSGTVVVVSWVLAAAWMLLIAGVCAAAVWNDLPPSERKQKKKKKMTTSSYTSVGSEMTLGGPLDAPDYRAASAYASSSTLWERPGGTPVGTPPPRTVVNSARDWDGLGRLEPAHVGQ